MLKFKALHPLQQLRNKQNDKRGGVKPSPYLIMGSINDLLKRLDAVDIAAESKQALITEKPLIIELNRERMLEGRKTNGKFLPKYSKISQEVYGYPNEPIKLRATGAFQQAISVEVGIDIIKTTSTDSKTAMLTKRYGEDVFGLGQPDRIDLVPPLRKTLVKNIKSKLSI